jgi:hypothetical protein
MQKRKAQLEAIKNKRNLIKKLLKCGFCKRSKKQKTQEPKSMLDQKIIKGHAESFVLALSNKQPNRSSAKQSYVNDNELSEMDSSIIKEADVE